MDGWKEKIDLALNQQMHEYMTMEIIKNKRSSGQITWQWSMSFFFTLHLQLQSISLEMTMDASSIEHFGQVDTSKLFEKTGWC